MANITFIGAGSLGFTQKLLTDILTFPGLRESFFKFMDIDETRLSFIERVAGRVIKEGNYPAAFELTTDRRKALEGADYVIVTILTGGYDAIVPDIEIPKKYGIDQCIGDTMGPGGVFRALRTVPVMLDICRDMEDICPDALMLNYTNPMSMICKAMNDYTTVKNIGLCHSVQGTADELAGYAGVPVEELSYYVAGINHQAWFLEIKRKGKSLYPVLRQKIKNKDTYTKDTTRFEMLKHFDYFVTESSGHNSEYVSYFRKNPEMIKKYCPGGEWNGGSGFILQLYGSDREDFEKEMEAIASGETEIKMEHSHEYASGIINGIETGEIFRFNGNVKNTGLITSLPENCCVEVPCFVDKTGINPVHVGEIPPHLAALNRTNIAVQELAVQAIHSFDRRKVFHAIMLDQLTAAILTLDRIQSMVDEMFEASRKWIPEEFY